MGWRRDAYDLCCMLSNLLVALYEPGLMPTINATGVYCYSAVDTLAASGRFMQNIFKFSTCCCCSAVIVKRQRERCN